MPLSCHNSHALSEPALREAELYQLITERTSDLIAVLNLAGQLIYASPSFQRVLGHDPVAVIEGGRSWFEFVHGEDIDLVASQFAELNHHSPVQSSYRLNHSNGAWRWIEAVGVPVDDKPLIILVGRDVTERIEIEAHLRHIQKLDSVGRLAGGVAHDFANLLTGIAGYAELMLHALPEGHGHRADLEEIIRSAACAVTLTQQLLGFVRRQITARRVLSLNDQVLESSTFLRRLLGESIELVTQLAPDVALVRADSSQLQQVLMNLVINARDAMPHGGQIVVQTGNVVLDHLYVQANPGVVADTYVMLAVSDTGTGMDQATLEHVFEPFFTTKPPGRGTGIGLSTCYGIVKQHGGSICVYSEPGQGTTVMIYLPQAVADLDNDLEAAKGLTDDLPRGDETVLIVEDEMSVREMVARTLQMKGYTVLAAPNGLEALQVARSYGHIDLLLTDVVMPYMNGNVLASLLCEQYPDLQVIYMTGYSNIPRDPQAIFLEKPFTRASLARVIRDGIDCIGRRAHTLP